MSRSRRPRVRTQVLLPLRFARRFRDAGAGVHLRRPGRRARAPGARARRPGGVGDRAADGPAAGPAAQRVPDRRRPRQRALRLRRPAARGGRAASPTPVASCSTCARRVAASASTPSSTPTRCRTRASTPTRPTSRSASTRTSATTRSRPRCCTRSGVDRLDAAQQQPGQGGAARGLGVAVTARCRPAYTSARPTRATSRPRPHAGDTPSRSSAPPTAGGPSTYGHLPDSHPRAPSVVTTSRPREPPGPAPETEERRSHGIQRLPDARASCRGHGRGRTSTSTGTTPARTPARAPAPAPAPPGH